MGCGCRGNKTTTAQPVTTTINANYEVFRGGRSTGRKFTSITSAQSYARSVGGDVVEISPQG